MTRWECTSLPPVPPPPPPSSHVCYTSMLPESTSILYTSLAAMLKPVPLTPNARFDRVVQCLWAHGTTLLGFGHVFVPVGGLGRRGVCFRILVTTNAVLVEFVPHSLGSPGSYALGLAVNADNLQSTHPSEAGAYILLICVLSVCLLSGATQS